MGFSSSSSTGRYNTLQSATVDVSSGNQIDCKAILGRPARGIQAVIVDPTNDEVDIVLNNLRRVVSPRESQCDVTVLKWLLPTAANIATITLDSTLPRTPEGLGIESFECGTVTDTALTGVMTLILW